MKDVIDSRDGDRLDFIEQKLAQIQTLNINGTDQTVRVWSFAGSPSMSIRDVIDRLMQEPPSQG